MPWRVHLRGHRFDLEDLYGRFRSEGVCIEPGDDGMYMLSCRDFEDVGDPGTVLRKAHETVTRLNGVMTITLAGYRPVEVAGVVEEVRDGTVLQTSVFAEPVMMRLRRSGLRATLAVLGSDGVRKPGSPAREDLMFDTARRHQEVDRALRLFGSDPSWAGLYKVYEIIEQDVGDENGMVNSGWPRAAEVKRFKQTANSVKAIGDEARHGRVFEAPRSPLSLAEARNFVGSLLASWLETKPH